MRISMISKTSASWWWWQWGVGQWRGGGQQQGRQKLQDISALGLDRDLGFLQWHQIHQRHLINCKESVELGAYAQWGGPATGIPYDIRNRDCLYVLNQINSFNWKNFNMIKIVRNKTVIHLIICLKQKIWFDNIKWTCFIQCLQPTWKCLALAWLGLDVFSSWTSHSPLWRECKSTLELSGICWMIFRAEVMHSTGV